MIKCYQQEDGFVRLSLEGYSDAVSCLVEYSFDKEKWRPAAVKKSCDINDMLDKIGENEWNTGMNEGTVTFDVNEVAFNIYWNRYLNIKNDIGTIHLRLSILTISGLKVEELLFEAEPERCIYLDKWSEYTKDNDPELKWIVRKDKVGFEILVGADDKKLPQIEIAPQIEGTYEVHICFANDLPAFYISTTECIARTIFQIHGSIYNLYKTNVKDKYFKEILWKTVSLKNDSRIQLSQIINENGALKFGNILYIKLVPVKKNKVQEIREHKNLTIFCEPYSYACVYGAVHKKDIIETIEQFMRLSPDEITYQVGRIGMKSLFHSKIVENFNQSCLGDDKATYGAGIELLNNVDILELASKHCKEKNIYFTANLGANRPYINHPELCDKTVIENKEKFIKNGLLDYSNPDVMKYAKNIIEEIVNNYDIDGMCFDFKRTEYNQTVDTLVEFMRQARTIMDKKTDKYGNRMRLSARIPWDSTIYYKAIEIWGKEKLVDIIIPSNSSSMVPIPRIEHYKKLCEKYNMKVYGCIDGWKDIISQGHDFGSVESVLSPSDMDEAIANYREDGADGIFLYQGDVYVYNQLIRPEQFD